MVHVDVLKVVGDDLAGDLVLRVALEVAASEVLEVGEARIARRGVACFVV